MPFLREVIASPWRAVPVLGVTQILAWGAIFYPPVLTVPLIADERGWSMSFAMGGFSLALLTAGSAFAAAGRFLAPAARPRGATPRPPPRPPWPPPVFYRPPSPPPPPPPLRPFAGHRAAPL